MALDALGEAELSYSPTPHDFTLFSDRLPVVLADSNDATTHASWLAVSLFLFFNSIMLFGLIETFTTI